MDVLVSGATGLIGTALVARLAAEGHRPRRLVRGQATGGDVSWDPAAGTLDAAALAGVDAVVHLAGAGIGDHRWTDAYKAQILSSRVDGTGLLSRTIAELPAPPGVLLSASAVGFYGDRGDEELDEAAAPGTGFLAAVCRAWEGATAPAEETGIRTVHLRSGVVLSAEGGALKKMLPLFKAFLGGRFGLGRQWQSWISIDDEVGAIVHLLTSANRGPVNLTAPSPVTNREFAATLGRVLGRPAAVPVPKFGPRLVLGKELADNLLFEGQRVLPKALQAGGYEFAHSTLEHALRAVLGRPAPTE